MEEKSLLPTTSFLYAKRGETQRFASRICGRGSTSASTARKHVTKAIGFAILQCGSSGRGLRNSSTYASPIHGLNRGHVTQIWKGTLTSNNSFQLLRVVMVRRRRDGVGLTTLHSTETVGVLVRNYSSSPHHPCKLSIRCSSTHPPSFRTLHSLPTWHCMIAIRFVFPALAA